jgi:sulfur relay (sulfurtransferase) DsrC/TusE family protein
VQTIRNTKLHSVGIMQIFNMLQRVVHTIDTGIWKVKHWFKTHRKFNEELIKPILIKNPELSNSKRHWEAAKFMLKYYSYHNDYMLLLSNLIITSYDYTDNLLLSNYIYSIKISLNIHANQQWKIVSKCVEAIVSSAA